MASGSIHSHGAGLPCSSPCTLSESVEGGRSVRKLVVSDSDVHHYEAGQSAPKKFKNENG